MTLHCTENLAVSVSSWNRTRVVYTAVCHANHLAITAAHSNTPQLKKRAPLTTHGPVLRCVSAADHHTAESYSKAGKIKPRSNSHEAIYHGILARTSLRTNSLRSCSGNRAKMLLKNHLGIKCHSQLIYQGHQTSSAQVNSANC